MGSRVTRVICIDTEVEEIYYQPQITPSAIVPLHQKPKSPQHKFDSKLELKRRHMKRQNIGEKLLSQTMKKKPMLPRCNACYRDFLDSPRGIERWLDEVVLCRYNVRRQEFW